MSHMKDATSVLMQLQSFLFAEKIDQDGGYQASARLSDQDVKRSLKVCKSYRCHKCSHSHDKPWPKIKGPPPSLIKVHPTDPDSKHVVVQGSSCQTTHSFVSLHLTPLQKHSFSNVDISILGWSLW